ncbi:MAG: gamma subclass chorismate mutase AroQ [Pseudomonadota bacterium]
MKLSKALTLFLVLASAPAAASDPADQVYGLIDARLELMQPVAAWKHDQGVAVEDKAREAVVLEKAVEAAVAQGIEPAGAEAFFRQQIEAAKEIQFCWLARWEEGAATPPAQVPDLKTEIRPQLIAIGAELLRSTKDSLATQAPFALTPFQASVEVECLSTETRDGLFQALSAMQLAP